MDSCFRPKAVVKTLKLQAMFDVRSTARWRAVGGMYQWLDRAPKGRNETGVWWRRHDEYDKR